MREDKIQGRLNNTNHKSYSVFFSLVIPKKEENVFDVLC